MAKKALGWISSGVLVVLLSGAYAFVRPEPGDYGEPVEVVLESGEAAPQATAGSDPGQTEPAQPQTLLLPPMLAKFYEAGALMSEEEYMQALHHMTHQKIHATTKWGALQVTEDSVQAMMAILSAADYENETFYQETLETWKAGDFSNAVAVHNQLWQWQGGTIGQAIRMLTPEEEAEFIREKFK